MLSRPLQRIRELNLAGPATAGRHAHLSAASGLVCVKSFLYVVADDELHLGVFGKADNAPGRVVRLFEGDLPESKKQRKRQKPDLEALTLLPPFGDYPHGALLAFGSGSTINRRAGCLIGLNERGAVSGSPRVIDLSPLLTSICNEVDGLNIEGAIVCGEELRLLQRGNKRHSKNAIIRFRLAAVLDALSSPTIISIQPVEINQIDMGEIGGVPLCFTDAAALSGGDMVFTAIAEDTSDVYNDGPCVGAAIGIADDRGNLRSLQQLDGPYKVEGVDAQVEGDLVRLLLVSDADDPEIPASLYATTLPLS